MRHRRLGSYLVSAALLAGWLSACSGTGDVCQPAALTLSHTTVAPGTSIGISSPAAACHLDLGDHPTYVLTLAEFGRAPAHRLGRVPVAADGWFHVTVQVPSAATPGPAVVEVRAPGHSFCPSDAASCAGSSVRLRIRR